MADYMVAADDIFGGDQFCVVFLHMVSWVGSRTLSVPENFPTYFCPVDTSGEDLLNAMMHIWP